MGPWRRGGPDRRGPLGGRAALVGRAVGDLRWLVRRVHGPLRARRGTDDVGSRGGPLWRLGDRRKLSPWRPAGSARPPQDDGLTRRTGPLGDISARIAGLSCRADRGPA